MKVWKFLEADRRLGYGDGRLVTVGKTLTVQGEVRLCERGIHGSVVARDALWYAPGSVVVRGDAGGMIDTGIDNLACAEFIPLAIVDAAETLRHFARLCALDVAHLWSPAPDTVRFLRTGDPTLRQAAFRDASSAAWAARTEEAVQAAARTAAQAAVHAAAWAAAATAMAAGAAQAAAMAAGAAAACQAKAIAQARAEIKGKQARRLERMLRELIRQETKQT